MPDVEPRRDGPSRMSAAASAWGPLGLIRFEVALGQAWDPRLKRSRFSEDQIIAILREHLAGVPISQRCHKHGVSIVSIYKWKWRHIVSLRPVATSSWAHSGARQYG